MRETQGQRSSEDFDQSGHAIINLKNANNIPKVFRIASNEFEFSLDGSSYRDLSTDLFSNNFHFYDNIFSDMTPSSSGSLSLSDAERVHLTKLKITFQKGPDSFSLSSYVYPINFSIRQKNELSLMIESLKKNNESGMILNGFNNGNFYYFEYLCFLSCTFFHF